eukprot:GHVR01009872.1.p1 GENE.GHVR01009872.1~~GHVR01009872.1.p1  ORF type:complete len:842 (+),score=182.87 GHVR01009872.1:51-2576(+)
MTNFVNKHNVWGVEKDEILKKIKEAINQINKQNSSSLSFEELYGYCYQLVMHKHAGKLYDEVRKEINAHVCTIGQTVADATDEQLLEVLREQWETHKAIMILIKDILMYMDRNYVERQRKLSVYDMGLVEFREEVVNHRRVKPRLQRQLTQAVALERAGHCINRILVQRCLMMLVELGIPSVPPVHNNRCITHRAYGSGVTEQERLFFYREYFENILLPESVEFYQNESREAIASCSVPDYLKKAESRILEEEQRVDRVLHPSSLDQLRPILETHWLLVHTKQIVHNEESGCRQMFLQDHHSEVARMWRLFTSISSAATSAFSQRRTHTDTHTHTQRHTERQTHTERCMNSERDTDTYTNTDTCTRTYSRNTTDDLVVDGVREILMVLRRCVLEGGDVIVRDERLGNNAVLFIEASLRLKQKYDTFLVSSFKSAKNAQATLKATFEEFANRDKKMARYLTLYIDDLFRKGVKSLTDVEIEGRLDEILSLFRLIHDKDVVEEFYKVLLAKRLLRKSSVSIDCETSLVAKLKAECGHAYTSKLEGMLGDLRTSESLGETYMKFQNLKKLNDTQQMHTHTHTQDRPLFELRPFILTTGYWPSATPLQCSLPYPVKEEADRFKSFYLQQHSGRRLTWHLQQGSAEVRGQFIKRHELCCSTIQMLVLLTFNRHSVVSYSLLQGELNLPQDELARHVMSLYVSPKYRILNRVTMDGSEGTLCKDISPTDRLEVNLNFNSKLLKIKLPLLAASTLNRGTLDAVEESHTVDFPLNVEEERKHLVEATIIRVMKIRKSCLHHELEDEVVRVLRCRFPPSPILIKQRIDNLITREYIERHSDDSRRYSYLA